MNQSIEQMTLFMYGVTLCGVVLFYVLLFGYRKRLKIFQEMAHTLEDVLASCPISLYGVRLTSNREKAFFSRRLCLFFNLVPEEVSFKHILTEVEAEGGKQLHQSFQVLKKQGIPWKVVLNHFTYCYIMFIKYKNNKNNKKNSNFSWKYCNYKVTMLFSGDCSSL